jgi:hypothetical protein
VLPVVDWLYERLNELFGWDLSQVDFDQALEDAQKITTSSTPPDLFGQQMDAQGNPMPGGQPPPNGQSQNGNTFDLASLGG